MLCRKCLEPLEYSFSRKRHIIYTEKDGPVAETIFVAVGHCLKDDHYSTILSEDNVRNKHYCISEIRSVLENKKDFSLASPRTRAYWKSWFRQLWNTVIKNIKLYIGPSTISKNDISIALSTFLKECGSDWLRYVLDIFSTNFNNLCIFFDIISTTIKIEGKKLHKIYANAPKKDTKPP